MSYAYRVRNLDLKAQLMKAAEALLDPHRPSRDAAHDELIAFLTADTITDEQIQRLRDSEVDEAIRDLCRVALQTGTSTGIHPFCRVCSWRKGGPDSWDGHRCKCKLSALPHFTCDRCSGLGSIPYNIGSQPCPSCDGSGLIAPGDRVLARARCAEILNERAKESR